MNEIGLDKFVDEYGDERDDIIQENLMIKEFNSKIENTNFHIYGLKGKWGVGKTTFIRLWEKSLNKNKFSVVHIDAFEKDYIQEPFEIIFSAFKEFMKENNISNLDAKGVIDCAKKIGFATLKGAGAMLINKFIFKDDQKVFADTFLNAFDYDSNSQDEDMCEKLKSLLKKIVEKVGGKKLYIVVDELDRCRPDFALEILEKIKHFFVIDGVKFILIYNPILFKGIVMQKYGCASEESESYFNKFIEYEIPFVINPNVLGDYIAYEVKLLSEQGCLLDSNVGYYVSRSSKIIAEVLIYFNQKSLRQIRKFIASVRLFEDVGEPRRVKMSLIISLLKLINENEYNEIVDYLKKNKFFDADAPKRHTYEKICSFFKLFDPKYLVNSDKSELDLYAELFEEFYENELKYFELT